MLWTSCKVCKTLIMNLIVGYCALYVAQMVYTAYVTICTRVQIEKVLCMYLVGILWVCTIVLLYYVLCVCASCIYWG